VREEIARAAHSRRRQLTARVGTSGWQYAHWRGDFYDRHLPTASWLEEYARRFDTVEVNNTFYRLPESRVFVDWRGRVPAGFLFAVKMSRYLTHIRRLRDPEEPVRRFVARAEHLRNHLGPVLVQLPPSMRLDLDRLVTTLRCFPRRIRVAVEVRHESWWEPAVRQALGDLGAAFTLTDRGGRPQEPLWRTASWTFVRFHGGRGRQGNYGSTTLKTWAQRIVDFGVDEAYVYFNNDAGGNAPRNALAMRDLLSGRRFG
jgi:uncharacterized protein YecE (DUF72 family)